MYYSSEEAYEIFRNKGIFTDFLQTFLENKGFPPEVYGILQSDTDLEKKQRAL